MSQLSEINSSALLASDQDSQPTKTKKPPSVTALDGLVQPKFLEMEMVHANNSKKEMSSASGNVLFDNNATLRIRIGEEVISLVLPLRYTGGDLGLTDSDEPWINFQDSSGRKYLTHSVQFVLQHINAFKEGRDQVSLLAAAALHYGLGAHALMGADLDNMCDVYDVLDNAGNVLLSRVTHSEACAFFLNPDETRAVAIRRVYKAVFTDERHEGPLVLLHHNLGVMDFTGVAVKSHVGRCGMMLEEILWRFDQFSAADQAELLAGLAKHFDLGQMHQVRRKTKAAA